MPTGYTAPVADGEADFESFLLSVAANFTPLMLVSAGVIPDGEITVDSKHYLEQIEKNQSTLDDLLSMTTEEATRLAENDYIKALEAHMEVTLEKARTKRNYQSMLALVEEWEPPYTENNEYDRFKNFLINQLVESMDIDCYTPTPPELETGEQWLARKRDQATDNLAYYREQLDKEITRAEHANQWITALRRSIKEFMKEKGLEK